MITKTDLKKLENLYKTALRESKELSTSNNRSSYAFSQGYEHGVADALQLLADYSHIELDAIFQEIVKEK